MTQTTPTGTYRPTLPRPCDSDEGPVHTFAGCSPPRRPPAAGTGTPPYARGMSLAVSRSVVVQAPAQEVFDLLADPARHPEFDGSGSVKARLRGAPRLGPGARFGMRMQIVVPYVIGNTVVEFEEGRRIAWRHFGRHVWRYELEPVAGGTRVTETFDWSGALSPRALELVGYPAKNARSIEQTLPRLKALAEA